VTDINRPLLGEPNAPCRTCGAPLAADQRYCLQCGARRAEARLPFLDILARQGPATAGGVTVTETRRTAGPAAFIARMNANSIVVAFVGCLLLALGVGVLIGGLNNNSNANVPQQVITVGTPAAGAAAVPSTAAPSTTTAPDTATTPAPKSTKKSSSSTASKSKSKATNNAVQNLNSSSTQDYQKKSSKLPKVLGTGGAAPPKDKKPAAGGGSFTEIG
jgi:hypothetical protein